jgi:hypothetical protein
MPFTINMIGTNYCGRTESHPDGSYITTEWITVVVPIIPLKSLRLRPMEGSGSRERYEVLEVLSAVHQKQKSYVYKLVAGLLFAWAVAAVVLTLALVLDSIPGPVKIAGYVIAGVIAAVAYGLFSYWSAGDPEESSSQSVASRPWKPVASSGDTPKQQSGQAKCPLCGSTTFRVEERAGSRRCSDCRAIIPRYIKGN